MEQKILVFLSNLCNSYKDEEDKDPASIDFKPDEITEDFTAMLMAMYMQYKRMTDSDDDLIGFTHLLNRLAMQYVYGDKC